MAQGGKMDHTDVVFGDHGVHDIDNDYITDFDVLGEHIGVIIHTPNGDVLIHGGWAATYEYLVTQINDPWA
jgi:hypothetical protein